MGTGEIVWLILMLTIAYMILSLRIVNSEEFAVLKRLGDLMGPELKARLYVIWWGIEKLVRDSREVEQLEIPAETHMIVRDDDAPLLPGQRHAMRIIHSKAVMGLYWHRFPGETAERLVSFRELPEDLQEEYRNDPLNKYSLASEIQVLVEWEIIVGGFIDFIITARSRAAVNHRIEDLVANTLQELLAPLPAGHTLLKIELIGRKLKEKVMDDVNNPPPGERRWGIRVRLVEIKSFSLGKRINTAQADATKAEFNKLETITTAEAEKERTILRAQGVSEEIRLKGGAEGDAERLVSEGKAAGIEALAAKMQTPEGKLAGQLQFGSEVIKEATYAVLPDAYGVVAGFGKVLEAAKNEPTTNPPKT